MNLDTKILHKLDIYEEVDLIREECISYLSKLNFSNLNNLDSPTIINIFKLY